MNFILFAAILVICPSESWASCWGEKTAKESAKYVAGVAHPAAGLMAVLVELFDTPCQDEAHRRVVRNLIDNAFVDHHMRDLDGLEGALRRMENDGHTGYSEMFSFYNE